MEITRQVPPSEVWNVLGDAAPDIVMELVDHFYANIEREPLLRPMYPEDLTEAKENLALFIMQYFGGPAYYAEKRGHPRLRMRHGPFAIGPDERDAWLRAMLGAVQQTERLAPVANTLTVYFHDSAHFLQNRD
jgi:hemoglobin